MKDFTVGEARAVAAAGGLRATLIAWGTCAVVATSAFAQQVPNAGRLLQDAAPAQQRVPSAAPVPGAAKPAAPAPAATSSSSARFVLSGARFTGNTVLGDGELASLIADSIGKQVSLSDLQELAARITKRYRDSGYFLGQAIVPRQEIVGGVVEFSIIEGKLGKLRLERAEGVRIDEAVIRRYLVALKPGEPLTEQALERTMLLLSDLPGVGFESTLEEGEEAGTVDLLIEASAGRRYTSQVELDNFGLKSSGEIRLAGGVRVANPLRAGDNLDMRLQLTSAARTAFGRASYERPFGNAGARFGIGFSSLGYSLGAPFDQLGAEGHARVLDATVSYPFTRTRVSNLLGTLQLQRKWVEDRFEAVDFSAKRGITNAVGGISYDNRDQYFGGGFVNLGAMLTVGSVDIGSQVARDLDSGPNGRRTDGSFVKLNYSASRLQALSKNWTLFGSLAGQIASKNLDNAERLGIGGPRAVRAYSSGALVADEGAIATVELRYALNPELTLSTFYDAGWARINRKPIETVAENSPSIRGFGLGVFWGKARNFQMQGSVAWRDSDAIPGDSSDRTPRIYLQGVKFF